MGEKTYRVAELGDIFLIQASDTVKRTFQNREQRKMLKGLGINKLTQKTYFELAVYYFWAIVLGIGESSIPIRWKEALKDAMIDSYALWTAEMARDNTDQDELLEFLIKKFQFYGETYTKFKKAMLDENSNPLIMNEIGQRVLKNWQHIISKDLNDKNVFDNMKFFHFFANSTIATSQTIQNVLREINIEE